MDAGPGDPGDPGDPDGGPPGPGPRVAQFDGAVPATAPDRVADLSSAGAGGVGHTVARLDRLDAGDPATGDPPAVPITVGAPPAGPRASAPVADLGRPDENGAEPGSAPVARVADLGVAGARRRRAGSGGSAVPGPGRRTGQSVAGSGRPTGTDDEDADPARGRRRRSAGRSGGRAAGRMDAGAVDEDGPPPPDDPAGDGADEPAQANERGRRGRVRSGRADPQRGTDRPGGRGRVGELDPDVDPVAVAREICLRLLTDRARTRHELAQALRRKGVPDEAAEQVLGRFDEVGLIDDAAFAGQWVRSRHRFRGLGRRAIAMELRRKGVDDEIAGEALAEVDGEAEEQRARQLVDRKLRSLTLTTPDQRVVAARRLVGMLARKGYPAGVAYGVVRSALADHGAQEDELGAEAPDE